MSHTQWFAFLLAVAFWSASVITQINAKASIEMIYKERAKTWDTSTVWRNAQVTDIPAVILVICALVFSLTVILLFFM